MARGACLIAKNTFGKYVLGLHFITRVRFGSAFAIFSTRLYGLIIYIMPFLKVCNLV